MLGELVGDFLPAARVLVLELHARGTDRVALACLGHAKCLEFLGRSLGFLNELLPLARRGAISAARDHERAYPVRIARVVGDAAVAPAEIAHLRLVGPMIAGEFMDEDDRNSGPRLFVEQHDAIVGRQVRHGVFPGKSSNGAATGDRPASISMIEPLVYLTSGRHPQVFAVADRSAVMHASRPGWETSTRERKGQGNTSAPSSTAAKARAPGTGRSGSAWSDRRRRTAARRDRPRRAARWCRRCS